jgi:hypothetical protein
MIILPILAFVLVLLLLQRSFASWRTSIICSAVTLGAILVGITEFLSVLRLVNPVSLALAWLTTVLLLFAAHIVTSKPSHNNPRRLPSMPPLHDQLFLCGGMIIVLVVGITAICAPPNTWDSMTYHMPRVLHWIQNQSVMHYATHDTKHLFLAPFAEFGILHLQLLSGGDRFANLVQFCSMIGCAVGVTWVAAQMGGSAKEQLLAAVLCVTLPMGVMQGSSTQNDYVVAFWIVSLAGLTLLLIRNSGPSSPPLLFLMTGGALGLAILTKATALIFTAPIGAILLYHLLRHRALKGAALIAVAAIMLNAGHFSRNLQLWGSPLGPGTDAYVNAHIGLVPTLANIVRNVMMHAATPVEAINLRTAAIVTTSFSALTGHDLNDRRATFLNTEFQIGGLRHEDYAANPLHLAIFLAASILLLRRGTGGTTLRIYLFAAVTAGVLFSAVLRWQPFHSRLQLPIFVTLSPVAAIVIVRAWRSWQWRATGYIALLYALSLSALNVSRPLIGKNNVLTTPRVHQYFANRPGLRAPYVEVARRVEQMACSEIGIGNAGAEYPLWILLGPDIRIHHVDVDNESAELTTAPAVCARVIVNGDVRVESHEQPR